MPVLLFVFFVPFVDGPVSARSFWEMLTGFASLRSIEGQLGEPSLPVLFFASFADEPASRNETGGTSLEGPSRRA